jgi:hypothetical protein
MLWKGITACLSIGSDPLRVEYSTRCICGVNFVIEKRTCGEEKLESGYVLN